MTKGTGSGKIFITDGYKNPRAFTVTVGYGSVGSSAETSVPMDSSDSTYPKAYVKDQFNDYLDVKLGNTAEIPAN